MSALPQPRIADADVWDALPSSVLLLAPDGAALRVNRALSRFCCLDAAALAGLRWLDLLPEAGSRRPLLDALARRRDFQLALAMRLPGSDGGMRDAWVDCAAQWQPEGGHYVCVLHDMSTARQAELLARAQAEQFRLLADNVPALIAYYDASDRCCLFANKQYARTFGWDERSIVGRSTAEIIGAEAAAQIEPQVDIVLSQKRPVLYERELKRADGSRQWIEVNLIPHLGPDEEPIACFVLISDITKHRLAEREARESEERLSKFMQASCEGIVFHMDGFITDSNAPACLLLGYDLEEMLGRKTLEFIAPEQVAKVASVIASGQETAYESVVVDKTGQRIPVEFIVRTVVRGEERLRMTVIRDIRDRVVAQARIHHLAHHDALTGLPNRMAFMQQLEDRIAQARDGGEPLALLFIDLDHFKRVNDSLGHLAGDTLLQTVAQRIAAVLRDTDRVARFGGDEFMVLLGGAPRRDDVAEVARKLLAAIEVPFAVEGRPFTVTPSIGIALYPSDGVGPAELIKHADTAMYRAKQRGRATYQFFDPQLASSAYAALVLEGELAQALERGEFVLHVQPQVRASDGALVGGEALIRWQHPQRGLLQPEAFIALAEQQRLMLPIGAWALREAVRSAKRWHDAGMPELPIAVNLSTLQFQAPDFVATVARVLQEEGLPGRLLELELTERMLMDDLPEVHARLAQLKGLGIRLAIDDFGTGYSSLGQLKALAIDKMKIDRSFVIDLPEAQDSAAIARAIIQMARSLGITVMAEGVETAAQRDFLAREGCDELQGEAISPPLSTAAFEIWAGRTAGG